MNRPPLEVADLVRAAGRAFIEHSRRWINWQHLKVLQAIARCRTAALGGHLDQCTDYGYRPAISYNSCRDRHCPKYPKSRFHVFQSDSDDVVPNSAWEKSRAAEYCSRPNLREASQDLVVV
jgi:Transposase zinc-binding domain